MNKKALGFIVTAIFTVSGATGTLAAHNDNHNNSNGNKYASHIHHNNFNNHHNSETIINIGFPAPNLNSGGNGSLDYINIGNVDVNIVNSNINVQQSIGDYNYQTIGDFNFPTITTP